MALGLLIAVASLLAELRLWDMQASGVELPGMWSTGSTVVVPRRNCSVTCGIFPHQGLNPGLIIGRQMLYH